MDSLTWLIPTNTGMWVAYGVIAIAIIWMFGGLGNIIPALNSVAQSIGGKSTAGGTVTPSGSKLSADDQMLLDDSHALDRLDARAARLNCPEMKAAAKTIRDHFFHHEEAPPAATA